MEMTFPESLKCLPIWILWKLELDKNGRSTKVPYSANYDGRASSINENTWSTYKKTVAKYESHASEYDGIGIMISPKYQLIFIDIDHCITSEDGVTKISPVAEDIVNTANNQFVELSQSGTGLHILAFGSIEKSFKNSKNGVEMYREKRFVAMTGKAVVDCEPHLDSKALSLIYEKYKPEKRTQKRTVKPFESKPNTLSLSDKEVLKRASERGKKFKYLYDGDFSSVGYGSQSEADLGLCIILAFWTDCDIEAMDRIFRSSGLYREKWEREDYRSRTLSEACDNCSETYSEYVRRKSREEAEAFEKVFLSEW